MKLKLYTTNSDDNVVNKTLTNISELDITLKNDVDIINPVLIVSDVSKNIVPNYAYIEQLKRYYFINDYTPMNANHVKIELAVDVLMTYKDDILNSTSNITKSKNPKYVSDSYDFDVRTTDTKYESDITLDDSKKSIVLVAIGG